jgi:hypothetical protein
MAGTCPKCGGPTTDTRQRAGACFNCEHGLQRKAPEPVEERDPTDFVTVAAAMEFLARFPRDARVYAYEGEDTGLVVQGADGAELGFLETNG